MAAELDGVHAEVVGHVVELREVVGIAEAAVGAEQAEGLVLDGRDDLLAVGVVVDVAALDDAARHAGVRLLAAARGVELADVVAAHLERLAGGRCRPAGRR